MKRALETHVGRDLTVYPADSNRPTAVVVLARLRGCGADCDQAIDNLLEAGASVYSHVGDDGHDDFLWDVASSVERALSSFPDVPVVIACDTSLESQVRRLAELFIGDIAGLVVIGAKVERSTSSR